MANATLLLIVLSGFFVTLSDAWNTVYKLNMLVHPFLGLAFTVAMWRYGTRRIKQTTPLFSTQAWISLPMGLAVLFAVPGIATAEPSRFYGYLALLGGWFSLGIWRLVVTTSGTVRFDAAANYLGLAVWTLALYSGTTAITLGLAGGIPYVFYAHRIVGIVFVGVLCMQIALNWRQRKPSPAFTFAAVAIVLTLSGAHIYERLRSRPSLTVHVSTYPIEARLPHERDMNLTHADIVPAALDLTQSCLASGCHQNLAKGFLASNHNISLQTPHIQKNMDLMAAEIGEHNTKTCLGCHAPAAMFDEALDRQHFTTHDNFSCSFCHVVSDVWLDPNDHLKSSYTVAPPDRHVNLFLADEREKETMDWLSNMAIAMNPLGHARAFTPKQNNPDELCVACHRHQIDLDPMATLIQPRCVDCHMPPQRDLGMGGDERSHFMPGANQLVPLFAGNFEAAEIVGAWIDGRYVISFGGWENRGWEHLRQPPVPKYSDYDPYLYQNEVTENSGATAASRSDVTAEVDDKTDTKHWAELKRNLTQHWSEIERNLTGRWRQAEENVGRRLAHFEEKQKLEIGYRQPARSVWISMLLRQSEPLTRGTKTAVEIVSSNAGIGHNFPAAPLDLAEVWLVVRIRDAAGIDLLTLGELDDNGRIPADAPRLGGTVLSTETGDPIELYRVWQPQKNVVWRVLEKGRHIVDRIEFDLPGHAKGPLQVEAHWHYRKLNRDFMEWAYGKDVDVPYLTVGSLSAAIPLGEND